jgi:hypothetical protein
MATELLTVIRPVVVASLPLVGSSTKGDTCVLTTDGHLYTFDGSAWVDNGAGAGSGLTEYQVRQRTILMR